MICRQWCSPQQGEKEKKKLQEKPSFLSRFVKDLLFLTRTWLFIWFSCERVRDWIYNNFSLLELCNIWHPSCWNSLPLWIPDMSQWNTFCKDWFSHVFILHVCAFTLTIILLRGLGCSSDSWAKCHRLDADFLRSELARGPEAGKGWTSWARQWDFAAKAGMTEFSSVTRKHVLIFGWGMRQDSTRLCYYINVTLSIAAV